MIPLTRTRENIQRQMFGGFSSTPPPTPHTVGKCAVDMQMGSRWRFLRSSEAQNQEDSARLTSPVGANERGEH